MSLNRRQFLALGAAAAASGCASLTGGADEADENLTVFISDVHVHPASYQLDRFRTVVDRILAMRPRPKRVVCFGDLAYLFGRREDYETSRPELERLRSAGIELTFGHGNHDRRGHFLEIWPEYRSRMLLKDRLVSETSLGTCDLVMLDTLWENHADETKMCQIDGQLDASQRAWLKDEMPRRKRPFFLACHHPIGEIADGGDWKEIKDLVMATPNCLGWIHGHDHAWKNSLLAPTKRKWSDNFFKRMLCLPSTGHWGDIGFVTMRTTPGRARAELTMLDHYFPSPDKPTPLDREIVAEKKGAFLSYVWDV